MDRSHRRRMLRLWALISGLIGAGTVALVIWFVLAFAQGRITNPLGWLFVLFPLFSIITAFKWQVVGGVLLILESSALIGLFIMGVLSLARIQSDAPFWWLLIVPLIAGLFLLISVVLFFVLLRQGQKYGEV